MITVSPQSIYEKLKDVNITGGTCSITYDLCEEWAPLINEINTLKKEKNAVILSHSYISPEINFSVADFTGDSYGLSKEAQNTTAETIIFVAVKFMAETAKILNPTKNVLIPNSLNGCSLADSISGLKVRELKQKYPSHTFVCYINTTADVKAECDVCVTSSNVYNIVTNIKNNKIYFLPDRLMGLNLIKELKKRNIKKEIEIYDGTCYVHEQYDPEMIDYIRLKEPNAKVLSHPECSPAILAKSDYAGSTSQMIDYVKQSKEDSFFLLTECGLTERLQVELPHKKFVGSCTQCKYMKSNTLQDILNVLKHPKPEQFITIDSNIKEKAHKCIENMFFYNK